MAFLGEGNDVFQWDPGDGSDVVEGQAGNDTMLFNGAAINEIFTLASNGGRALFTRNVANITMDLNDVERVELNALGGADTFNIGDLSGTDVKEVVVNLAVNGAGDALPDAISVAGRNGADTVTVATVGAETQVTGLPAAVRILGAEAANDTPHAEHRWRQRHHQRHNAGGHRPETHHRRRSGQRHHQWQPGRGHDFRGRGQ